MIALYIISSIALILSVFMTIIGLIKYKSILVNIYNLSKGMDVLYTNQEKILELTKVKGFVQLINEEEREIRKEIKTEKSFTGSEKTQESVRPPDSDTDNEGE